MKFYKTYQFFVSIDSCLEIFSFSSFFLNLFIIFFFLTLCLYLLELCKFHFLLHVILFHPIIFFLCLLLFNFILLELFFKFLEFFLNFFFSILWYLFNNSQPVFSFIHCRNFWPLSHRIRWERSSSWSMRLLIYTACSLQTMILTSLVSHPSFSWFKLVIWSINLACCVLIIFLRTICDL